LVLDRDLPRRTMVDLGEGLALAYAAAALHFLGILEGMSEPVSLEDLATRYRVDREILRAALDYLACRTNLLRRVTPGYATGASYDAEAKFVLSLYARAYAPTASRLADILKRPHSARKTVDDAAMADAFGGASAAGSSLGALPAILRQLKLGSILELGCGTAGLLADLASSDSEFLGWGIDRNLHMCRKAKQEIKQKGLADRVKIIPGDGEYPDRALLKRVAAKIQTILASNFANEMCQPGYKRLMAWLKRIKRYFPDRVLVICDYYGRLSTDHANADQRTLLHDFCQVISGQGIPPADLETWQSIYNTSGCRLAHVINDERTTRFVHILRT
jgi:hypothetical protein